MGIYFAPMEGITRYVYRNAFEKYYGGVDKYFAPFIAPAERCPLTPREREDILPDHNTGLYLVPQILTQNSQYFIECADKLWEYGYKELNLNLGCPSGIVCSKGKGAGFLRELYDLERFLDPVYEYAEKKGIQISIKTRIGWDDPGEWEDILYILNEFPISELIVHPRVRMEYYRGQPHKEAIDYAIEHCKIPLIYNGNIFTANDLAMTQEMAIDGVMIGRGLLKKPDLLLSEWEFSYEVFRTFHDDIYQGYGKLMDQEKNIIYPLKELWTYWKEYIRTGYEGSEELVNNRVKQILTASTPDAYKEALIKLDEIFMV